MTEPKDAHNTEATLRELSLSTGDAAISTLEGIGRECPEDPTIHKFIGIAHYQRGHLEKAVQHLVLSRDLRSSEDQETDLFLLRAFYRLNDFENAGAICEGLLTVSPTNLEALTTRARIASRAGETGYALELWKRIAGLPGHRGEAALQVARLAWRNGDFEAAEHYGQQARSDIAGRGEAIQIQVESLFKLGRISDAAAVLPAYYTEAPERALAALKRIDGGSRPEDVAKALTGMSAHGPEDKIVAEMKDDWKRHWQMEALQAEFESDDLRTASFLRAIRTIDPADTDAIESLRRLKSYSLKLMRKELSAGRKLAAIESAERAIAIDPATAEAHFDIGRIAFDDARFADAVLAFAQAVSHDSENAWYWLNYARSLDRVGRLADAVHAFRQVSARVTEKTQRHEAEVERALQHLYSRAIHTGRQDYADGDLEKAWAAQEVAADLRPGNDQVSTLRRTILRKAYEHVNRFYKANSDEIIDAAARYLKMDPDHQGVLVMYGRALMRVRDYRDALQAWERLLKNGHDDMHYHLQIARCCSWLKLRDRGIEAAQKVLEADSTQSEAESIIQRLRSLTAQP